MINPATEYLKEAIHNLQVAVAALEIAREFDVYTKNGMVHSQKEIADLDVLIYELQARIENLK